jgi:hypothetical protein
MFAGMPRQVLQQGQGAFDTGLGCHTAGSLRRPQRRLGIPGKYGTVFQSVGHPATLVKRLPARGPFVPCSWRKDIDKTVRML